MSDEIVQVPHRMLELRDGATVTFFDKMDVTARRRRPVEELQLQMGNLLGDIIDAREIVDEDGNVVLDEDALQREATIAVVTGKLVVSPRQAHLLRAFQDAITFMYLKDWTLKLKLPSTPDDLLDLPGHVLDQIEKHTAVLYAYDETSNDGFDARPENRADAESPTSGSVVSTTP